MLEPNIIRRAAFISLRSQDSSYDIRSHMSYYVAYTSMQATFVKKFRSKRISWAGHIIRIVKGRPTKEVFPKAPNITRRRGRQRTRWVAFYTKWWNNLSSPFS